MSKTWGRLARRTVLPLAAMGTLWVAGEGGAHAAQTAPADANQLEEIVVTATKRAERIQDIPISVTAITGAQLAQQGADNFVDYAREVPSLTFAERGNGRNDITIRGLSVINGVATVGYYLDGV